MTLTKKCLFAFLIAMLPTISFSGSYVDEEECFGGAVPPMPVGQYPAGIVSTTVNAPRGGTYLATAWRQVCQTDAEVSVLLIRFQALSGSPSVSSLDVLVTQADVSYRPMMLVKNPRASLLTEHMQLGTFSSVNTIVRQAGQRFEVKGRLQIELNSTSGTTSMYLGADPTAGANAALEVHYGNLTDMWWDPSQNGTGMSIIHHGSNQMFAVWYTYNDAGDPLWIVLPGGTWEDSKTYSGALYKTRGTGFSQPWNQAAFQVGNSVGTGRFAFTADDAATFTYTVNGVSGSRTLTRQRY